MSTSYACWPALRLCTDNIQGNFSYTRKAHQRTFTLPDSLPNRRQTQIDVLRRRLGLHGRWGRGRAWD